MQLGKLLHIHGTTRENMVFGVNDISQLANSGLLTKDRQKERIIKPSINARHGLSIIGDTTQLIQKADLIYIYGMSLGKTDQMWWEIINKALLAQENLLLIINDFELPSFTPTNADRYDREDYIMEHFSTFLSRNSFEKNKIKKKRFLYTIIIFLKNYGG